KRQFLPSKAKQALAAFIIPLVGTIGILHATNPPSPTIKKDPGVTISRGQTWKTTLTSAQQSDAAPASSDATDTGQSTSAQVYHANEGNTAAQATQPATKQSAEPPSEQTAPSADHEAAPINNQGNNTQPETKPDK